MNTDLSKKQKGITSTCLTLSLFTTLVYHIPAFRTVIDNVENGLNGVLIFASVVILMITANYLLYYLLLWVGRIVGKTIIALVFIANAVALYFINTYEVLITANMMGNVFNTRFSEASGFFSFSAIAYITLLGIPPVIYLFAYKTDYSSFRKFLANIGTSLLIIIIVLFANLHNTLWIDNNSQRLGSQLIPWSYIVNSVRYISKSKKRNQKEILLPDAQFTTESNDVCVLIIGESARQKNFSLYGYQRETNPLLATEDIKTYKALSAATFTTAAVKAILDHKPTDKLYEILPNYLYRNGADVVWHSFNWGEPPLHIEKYKNHKELAKQYPDSDARYDELLLKGLKEEILACNKKKQLIVLHLSTSHGPTYNKKYPAEFELFTPACNSVEISTADKQELLNAYDNTILYTDYLLHSTIEILKQIPDRRCCMIFVSDHGESLGEGNLFMHGIPKKIAPKEQIEIPFIVWQNDSNTHFKELSEVGQYHIFHSVMNYLGIHSAIYNEDMNIFERRFKDYMSSSL